MQLKTHKRLKSPPKQIKSDSFSAELPNSSTHLCNEYNLSSKNRNNSNRSDLH